MASVIGMDGGGTATPDVRCGAAFRVLGPLTAEMDGIAVALGGPKERTVLAVLLAAEGRPVTVGALVDALWGDSPPPSSERTLHVYVSRLRRSLGAESIVTHGRGYALVVDPEAVDARRFDAAAAAGRAARERGDPGGAVAAFDRALVEWSGAAFLGLDEVEACEAAASRLDESRRTVVEERFEAMLDLGHAADLIADLSAAVAAEPYREHLWASLMVAQYRAGRRTEALRSYQQARRALVDGIGVEPGPHLRATEAAILADDPGAWGVSRAMPTLALPTLLDPGGSTLVGRDTELDRLRDAWAHVGCGAGQLISITGPEGSGKTRLIAELALEVHLGGGVVACARFDSAHRTGRSVLDQALRSAGGSVLAAQAEAPAGDSLGVAVARLLARWSEQQPVLFVLDDLHEADDHVLAVVSDVAAGIAAASVLVVNVFRGESPEGVSAPTQVAMRPLGHDDVAAVCQLYGDDWTGAEVEAISVASQGWPRAVHEAAAARTRRSSGQRAGAAADAIRQAEQRLVAVQEALTDEVVGMRRSERVRRRESSTRHGLGSVGAPFRGLASFDRSDSGWFFGRDAAVAEIVAELAAHPAVAVVGASGSGKSSLVRAGVLPALADGMLPGSDEWDAAILTPGTDPVGELRAVVDASVKRRRLIVVDQFEELFALGNSPSRDEFAELLFDHAAGGGLVIVVVRADQFARLAELSPIATMLSAHTVLVAPMLATGLREAIERPLDVAGQRAEDGLVETIVADARGAREVLPLLQTVLLATWERREGDVLTIDGYRASGGVAGAIARLAEEMYASLTAPEAAAARRMFVRLVDVDRDGTFDLRRKVARHELVGDGEESSDSAVALAAAVRSRLVVLDVDTAEITHEALVREWPRLNRWIEEDHDGHRLHQRLGDSARAWLAAGRDPSELLRGARLEAVDEWASAHLDHLNDAERELLAASRTATLTEFDEIERRAAAQTRSNTRLRHRLVLAGVLLVLALAATSIAIWQWQRQRDSTIAARQASELATNEADAARVAKDDAEASQQVAQSQAARAQEAEQVTEAAKLTSDARLLAADALVDQHIDRALLSAVAGVRLEDRPETRIGILSAVQRAPLATRVGRLANGARPQAIAMSPDGRQLAVPDNLGLVHLLDATTLQETSAIDGGWGLRFLPDGSLVVAGPTRSALRILDAAQSGTSTEFSGGPISARFVDVDPTGDRVLATGNANDQGALWWDIGTPAQPAGSYDFGDTVRGLALVDSGRSAVIVGTGAKPAEIVDLATGRVTTSFPGRDTLAVNPDRTLLATASGTEGRTVVLHAVGASEPVQTIGVPATVTSLAFSPDGQTLAVGMSEGTELYGIDGSSVLRLDGQTERSRGVAFAPDGSALYGVSLDGTVMRWDITGTEAGAHWRTATDGLLGPGDSWYGLYVSPLGDVALPVRDTTRGDILVVIGAESGARLRLLTGHRLPGSQGEIYTVAWAPDGTRVATGSGDAHVRLWDARTGDQLGEWEAPLLRSVTSATFDQSGERLLVGLGNDTLPEDAEPGPDVIELDAETLAPVNAYEIAGMQGAPYRAAVSHIAADPSGRVLVYCCGVDDHSSLTSIDRATGEQLWSIETADPFSIAFSPNSELVAVGSADGTLKVLRASDGSTAAGPVDAHDGWADTVDFHPDGASLVTGGTDGLTRLWRTADLKPLGTYDFAGGRGQVNVGAVFTDGGQRLRIYDGTKLWEVLANTDDLIAQACSAVARDLTRAEWSALVPDQPYRPTCP